jgi:RpiB/LacA/LacB family sugar-phosphate isomerase
VKAAVVDALVGRHLKVRDLGAHGTDAVDYPDYAGAVARSVASGEADFGVLICGSGIGMSIAANKVPGIRAALASDVETVRLARQHNDANVLVLAANRVDAGSVPAIMDAWLQTSFEGGRHEQRIKKIDDLERER